MAGPTKEQHELWPPLRTAGRVEASILSPRSRRVCLEPRTPPLAWQCTSPVPPAAPPWFTFPRDTTPPPMRPYARPSRAAQVRPSSRPRIERKRLTVSDETTVHTGRTAEVETPPPKGRPGGRKGTRQATAAGEHLLPQPAVVEGSRAQTYLRAHILQRYPNGQSPTRLCGPGLWILDDL